MTKYQRSKHKQPVDELKWRKSNGENNLILRNREIIPDACMHKIQETVVLPFLPPQIWIPDSMTFNNV